MLIFTVCISVLLCWICIQFTLEQHRVEFCGFTYSKIFKNSVVIASDCDVSFLNGHYEKYDFVAPSWYLELVNNKKIFLIIDNLNGVEAYEQGKFIEIIKYRKVSTFDLPDNCIVVALCSSANRNSINEEICSLMARI